MTSETIADILEYAPNVQCFAIASDDLAQRNAERAAKQLPRAQRRKAGRYAHSRWKRSVDSIIDDARTIDFNAIIARLETLPLDAVHLTFDAQSADEMINRLADEIRERPTTLIGIWEQFVSDDLVFVWLWNDK